MTDNVVQDELQNLFSSCVGQWDSLDPLCEVLSGGNNILVAICRIWVYLTNEIESPVEKGAWGDGGLEVLGRSMYQIAILLTRNTSLHKMICIYFHSRPIVTYLKNLFC